MEHTAGSPAGGQSVFSAENGYDTAMRITTLMADRTEVGHPVVRVEQNLNPTQSRDSFQVSKLTTLQDIFRLHFDIFLYAILMCNVLKYSSTKIFESLDSNIFEIAHLIVLVCTYIILVYPIRLIILFVTLRSLKRSDSKLTLIFVDLAVVSLCTL